MGGETEIEKRLRDKRLDAPRITPDMLDSVIVAEQYHQFPDTTVTVCCLTLLNGYNIVGYSACVSDRNFDAEIGKEVAKEAAREKIWALEGYLLKHKLSKGDVSDYY